MSKNPYLHALAAAAYIAGIVLSIQFASSRISDETLLVPILMLSLLVFSVAMMGYLFGYRPAIMLMDGDRSGAMVFFLKTIAAFALWIILLLTILFFFVQPSDGGKAEEYVREHISTLSPEKEVLGGKFYVTDIEAADGKGVVHYEDGHIALVADFAYTTSGEKAIEITSFIVRP